MYKYLGQVKKEMNDLEHLYKEKVITKQEYKMKLDYLKEYANFLKYEKICIKTK